MKTRYLTRSIYLNSPIEKVFDFFSKAENLNVLTPPSLHFKILTPTPFEMKAGTLIDYRIKMFGIPFKWRTKITHWQPTEQFIDSQIKGPYVKWIHSHTFEIQGDGILMHDTVEYACPGWIFEPIIFNLVIKNALEDIFSYRNEKCKELFG